jgi:carboxymethylenebutenolidase
MRNRYTLLGMLGGILLWTGLAFGQEHDHSQHTMMESKSKAAVGEQDEKLPPGEDGAKAALEKSPRHGEWVDVKYEGSEHPIRTWIVYPEKKEKAPVVIVIHEIYGVTDWIRAVSDQLAKDGYLAVAPDLISGMGPGGGGTESVATRDEVVRLIRGLSAEEATQRLHAVRSYAIQLPSANGKSATVGYCWGGSMSFGYACVQPGLNAAIVYYGTSPAADALGKLSAPVLGFYGGDDARVNATIEAASAEIKKLGKTYEYEIYEGAGHGFLRQQSGREGANLKATQQAWPRMLSFLKKHL